MDDEKERSRSSILKPHKRRNPLGDIDVQAEEEDFPSSKTRRVSFASSNQIKKFSTDEDKNTIWDSTYEECIEGSENTPSSLPHSTKSVIIAEENIEITVNTVHSRLDNDELEFTPPVGSGAFEMSTVSVAKREQFITNVDATMEFTQMVSVDIDVAKRRSANKTIVFVDGNDEMEFTSYLDVTIHDKTIITEDMSIDNVEMSFTQPILQNIQQNADNIDNISYDKSMEFTTAINNPQFEILTKDGAGDRNDGNINGTTDMEFTTAINNVLVATVENNDTHINISAADMEFTTAINNQECSKTINNEDLKSITNKNTSVLDMEFTTAIDQQQTTAMTNKTLNNSNFMITNKNNSNTTTVDSLPVDSEIKNINCNIDQQQNRRISNKDISRNISSVDMELDITDDKLNTLQKVNDENVNEQLRNEELKNESNNLTGRNISSLEQSKDFDATLKYSANNQTGDKHCEISIDDIPISKIDNDNSEQADKSKLSEVALLEPLSNDPSMVSMIQLALENITNNDDTQQLINYQLNEKNQTKSDLSRVAAGDLNPSFSKLRNMPLGEYNSNSFHVSLNNVLDAPGLKLNVTNASNVATMNLTSETTQNDQIKQNMSIPEGTITDIVEITDDMSKNCDLCNTQPPEELLEITNSTITSVDLQENLHDTTMSTNIDNDSVFIRKQSTENFNDQVPLLKKIMLPKKPLGTMKNKHSLKDLCNKINDLITSKVEDCVKLSDHLKSPVLDSDNSNTKYSDVKKISNEQSCTNEFLYDDAESEKSIDLILKDLEESNKKYWQLLSIDNITYKFAILFRTIFLTVKLEDNSDKVENFEIEKKIDYDAEPEALYIHKILCERLSPKCIKSALGDKYDVRSLLDFIKETMHKLLDFLKEYDQLFNTYGLTMDKNFRLEFSVIKINLLFAWKFTINVLELNCITDTTVEYYAKFGSINDREIKQCIEKCPTGTSFIRAFVENIYSLVSRMENEHRYEH